jgi:hypothetical protein
MTPANRGGIAQLVERLVRNEKVRGSNPLTSTFEARIRLRFLEGVNQFTNIAANLACGPLEQIGIAATESAEG